MYLVDTDVISEARKQSKADPGVTGFFAAAAADQPVFLSVVSLGELRRGVELIRRRGDHPQAERLEAWLTLVLTEYADRVLPFDADAAQLWGHLRAPNPEPAIDKQIAAIALLHNLTVVTRNTPDFAATGVRLHNPFASPRP
jgi:predicted nucleic acid-binding protein